MHYIFDTWHSGKHSQTERSMIYKMLCKTICELLYSNSGVRETEKIFSPTVLLGAEFPAAEGRLARKKPSGFKSFKEPRILSKERGCRQNGVICAFWTCSKESQECTERDLMWHGRNCGRVSLPLFTFHKGTSEWRPNAFSKGMLHLRMSEFDFFYCFLRW